MKIDTRPEYDHRFLILLLQGWLHMGSQEHFEKEMKEGYGFSKDDLMYLWQKLSTFRKEYRPYPVCSECGKSN